MERDSDGQFLSPSLNYIMNQAYSNGARIHTNSWGSSSSADFGKYTSQSEDVDDRAHTYDRYSSGYEGFVILFAAGNDGPNTGTVGAPGTAKNSVTVGNHQNRYGNSPDTMMSDLVVALPTMVGLSPMLLHQGAMLGPVKPGSD